MTKLKVGEEAPDFVAKDSNGKDRSLKEFAGKILILYFYPKDDTPGCTKEACSFRDQYEQFIKAGAEVVGVSSDSEESHQKFISKYKLPFTLLTDPKGELAKTYGVGKELLFIPGRTTFVIDREQKVQLVHSGMMNAEAHITESLKIIENLSAQK
ncbi:AhpC/TSA family protein [Tieghemostelium lacteum]|uniref:thioredoxin-dependent peroxiredoxin n=1 Tax=Tieghemostelium lacteum TaxID=361077 RepID=A0A151Z2J6_TIELA|nr:AhpC/TSA family protein [Tieghemostelium lacteum]|eukprot:KYQ88182.1 AhpC/TSA family protein [Tieghemostelium lacteum]